MERQTETWVKNHQGFVVVLGRKKRSQPCSKRPQKAWFLLRLTIQSDREKELVVASKYACMQETIQFARHHENRLGPKLFNSSVITFLS
jgi:hypothetical protein